MPQASAAAAPPLLPPHVLSRSYGLYVGPNTGLKVCEPAPNSGVLVFPMVIAPAALWRSTITASVSGKKSLKIGEPNVVRMPLVGVRSLCATGRPANGPGSSPRLRAASTARAPALVQRLAAATAVINVRAYSRFDETLPAAVPELKKISILGTGTDNIDLDAAARRGVVVTNTPKKSTLMVAD